MFISYWRSLTVGSDDVDDAHPTVIGVGDTEEELSAVTPEVNPFMPMEIHLTNRSC